MTGESEGRKTATSGPRKRQPRRVGTRAGNASAIIGPFGYLLSSASTAKILRAFSQAPSKPLGLRELQTVTGANRGALQTALHNLQKAHVIVRDGRGPATVYRFHAEGGLGRAVLGVVEASRLAAEGPRSSIPWLAGVADLPAGQPLLFHGGRTEPEVSEAEAARVVESAEPVGGSRRLRTRPGFVGRG